MKKILAIALLTATCVWQLSAQEEKEVKKGWSLGILPTATWSTDNGFQAGAFGDVYYYGDGSTYPDPLHKISWEASYFTHSHRMRLYLAYDSKYLIPNMRVNASVTYMNDPLYSFWGFNGPASTQNYDLWSNKKYIANKKGEIDYPYIINAADGTPIPLNYYGMSRNMLRILANVQGRITDNLNWAAGINFWKWGLGNMKDNGVKDNDGNIHKYDTEKTLYQKYIKMGAITEAEKDGGLSLELNAGLVFDTRDMEAAPNKGIWAEAYLNGAPYAGNPATGLYSPYLKACVYFRQYISLPINFIKAGKPVFAYRLAWQHTILGETPFYMIQNNPLLVQRNMISEGFGSSNTIRGLRENRILAEGFAWANTELRVKLVSFKFLNQFFYIAVNPFFDAGIITKEYRPDVFGTTVVTDDMFASIKAKVKAENEEIKEEAINNVIYDSSKAKDLIYSGGIGLKIAMNQNFIVSAEFAKCFYGPNLAADPWIGIGINYQF